MPTNGYIDEIAFWDYDEKYWKVYQTTHRTCYVV